jgi:hypothetical protein
LRFDSMPEWPEWGRQLLLLVVDRHWASALKHGKWTRVFGIGGGTWCGW